MEAETMVGTNPTMVESFESFYDRVWQQAHRAVSVGTSNPDLAADAVEEAMVRAYERWSKVSAMNNPEGWVYVVAMNWARSRLRRRKYRSDAPVPDIAVEDPPGSDPQLIAAVRNLPFHQREVVVARYLLDMSEADMSETLGVAKGTVKSRLHRALETLRKDLS